MAPVKLLASIDKNLREEIKRNLKDAILKYVSSFKYKSTQPLDLLIPKERKIRSIVGGLETSMGTKVWEPIALTLAKSNGFNEIKGGILKPEPFPKKLASTLEKLIRQRENKSSWINIKECVSRLKQTCHSLKREKVNYIPPAAGTGVDLWFEKNGKEFAFDIKTVQPNVGSIKSFNKELLEWYAYRIFKNPDTEISCKIAYPYSPYKTDFWKHTPHSSGLLEPGVDAVVEDEFWDFLSGLPYTYQQVSSIFIELNDEGFGRQLSIIIDKIHFINPSEVS